MRVTLNQTVSRYLQIISPSTGFPAAPDSTPTAVVRRNGSVDGAVTPTITLLSTGFYRIQFTVPNTYAIDDEVALIGTFVLSGNTVNLPWQMQVDATVNSRMATFTLPTNFASLGIDGSGRIDLGKWLGTAPLALSSQQVQAIVSAYAAGQDPATQVLATPANKLATDGSGRVTVGTNADKTGYALSAAGIQAFWDMLVATGSTVANSFGAYVKAIGDGLAGRYSKLDFLTGDAYARLGLPAGSSIAADIAANQAAILNITQGTFLATDIPVFIERPDAGTESLIITLVIADETGAAADIDAGAMPTVVLTDHTGTNQGGRLSAWTKNATGKYQSTYTSSSTDGITRLRWEITATINGKVRRYVQSTEVVDTTAVSFTAADRTALNAIKGKTDNLPASPAATGDAMALTSGERTTLSGVVKTSMETAGGFLELVKTRVLLAIPAFAPSNASGLPLKSDLPVAPDNTGISNALTQATNAAASASSADGKLTTGRLANLDAATPTRLGILDRLASMMEQVTGLWRWTSNTLSQAPSGGGGGGSAATLLVRGPFQFKLSSASSAGIVQAVAGDTGSIRGNLVDATGEKVPLTGATLTAQVKDLSGTVLLSSGSGGFTITTLLADEGLIELALPLTDPAFVAGRRYRIIFTRTLSGNVSRFYADLVLS